MGIGGESDQIKTLESVLITEDDEASYVGFLEQLSVWPGLVDYAADILKTVMNIPSHLTDGQLKQAFPEITFKDAVVDLQQGSFAIYLFIVACLSFFNDNALEEIKSKYLGDVCVIPSMMIPLYRLNDRVLKWTLSRSKKSMSFSTIIKAVDAYVASRFTIV